jgi:hypothetical protein
MRKLYNLGTFAIDNGEEAGARRQHCMYRIFQAPVFVKPWSWSGLEVECEKLGEFFDTEWAGNY